MKWSKEDARTNHPTYLLAIVNIENNCSENLEIKFLKNIISFKESKLKNSKWQKILDLTYHQTDEKYGGGEEISSP